MNGDGGTSNDLIYVPRDIVEMNFQSFAVGTRTFTPAEQARPGRAYIQQDDYLSKRRGQYVQRGGKFLPMVRRMDVSLAQNVFHLVGDGECVPVPRRHDNFGNLLNSDWGVGQRPDQWAAPDQRRG